MKLISCCRQMQQFLRLHINVLGLGTQWLMRSLLHPEVGGACVDEHGKHGPVSRARKGKKVAVQSLTSARNEKSLEHLSIRIVGVCQRQLTSASHITHLLSGETAPVRRE